MALNVSREAILTTPVDLKDPETDGIHGQRLLIANRSGSAVFLGGSDVTDATGWELPSGREVELHLEPTERLYAVAATGTLTALRLDVLRQGV